MKRILLLSLLSMVFVACAPMRHVTIATPSSWVGATASDILSVMGEPDRIEEDGRSGSILAYGTAPDYEDPDFDVLDPEAVSRARKGTRFYLDQTGVCYKVDGGGSLPAPPRRERLRIQDDDWLTVLTLVLLVGFLL